MTAQLPVVVLLSGRGSNMKVLAERAKLGVSPIEIRAVISDRAAAGGLQLANNFGIPTSSLATQDYPTRGDFDSALAQRIEEFAPQLVVLAGYMRILSTEFVQQFAGRLLNIHPSLLPKYPGLHTHRRALAAGDTVHGASVHFVTEELDGGPVIVQGRVAVMAHDTEATLSARVQQIEHSIYPQAIDWFAAGRLAMHDGMAWLDKEPIRIPTVIDLPVVTINA